MNGCLLKIQQYGTLPEKADFIVSYLLFRRNAAWYL